ncbi:MAG: hypothetical protein GY820_24620 [Gammaproteobacteria bacterium]|nr:hypothetical protein [Gammaproteobacteria bacterium]
MIKNILFLLQHANGETESIQIAQGKNKLPMNLKEGYKAIKREIRWHKK